MELKNLEVKTNEDLGRAAKAAQNEANKAAENRSAGLEIALTEMQKKNLLKQVDDMEASYSRSINMTRKEREENYRKLMEKVAESGANLALSVALLVRRSSGKPATQDKTPRTCEEEAEVNGASPAETVSYDRKGGIDAVSQVEKAVRKAMAVPVLKCFDLPQKTILGKARRLLANTMCWVACKVFGVARKVNPR